VSILQFRRHRKAAHIERDQEILTRTMMEIFADTAVVDLALALGAGHRALERGTPFFEALEYAEGVIKICNDPRPDSVALMAERNRERLTEYRIKKLEMKRSHIAAR
jgi:hypothetical protein